MGRLIETDGCDRVIVVEGADYVLDIADEARADTDASKSAAVTARDAAAASAASSATSAGASAGSAVAASASAAAAAVSEANAGTYKNAVTQAVAGLPANAQLPLPAATRTALAAISTASLATGAQAYLSEAGHAGAFQWSAGDQTARFAAVTFTEGTTYTIPAPAGQSLFVAPASAPSGANGCWVRTDYRIAFASWAGITTGGAAVSNGVANQDRLNWLMRQPGLSIVTLDTGVTGVSACVFVPNGKTLSGMGQNRTTLMAVGFTFFSDGGASNHMVRTATGAMGTRITDMAINGAKIGIRQPGDSDAQADSRRIHGCTIVNGADCLGQRLLIANISGYGQHIAGGRHSGFEDGRTVNCKVHNEATNGANSCWFSNFYCSDGDGDIPCEAWCHTLGGAYGIIFDGGLAIGTTANPAYVVLNTDADVYDIKFRNIRALILNSANCFVADESGGYTTRRFEWSAEGCDFTSAGGALVLGGRTKHRLTNCRLRTTGAQGFVSGGTGHAHHQNVDAALYVGKETVSDGTTVALWIMDPTTKLTVDGGTYKGKSNGENAPQPPAGVDCRVVGAPNLDGIPHFDGKARPWGVGHKLTMRLDADETRSDFVPIGEGSGKQLGFYMRPGGEYRVRVDGMMSVADHGVTAWLNGNGPATVIGGSMFLQASLNDNDPLRSILTSWQDGLDKDGRTNGQITATATAGAKQRFSFDALIRADGADAQGMIYALWTDGPGGFFGGQPRTVYAGTALTIEQVA